MANTGSSYLQQARNTYVNGKELQPEAAPAAVPNLYQCYHLISAELAVKALLYPFREQCWKAARG